MILRVHNCFHFYPKTPVFNNDLTYRVSVTERWSTWHCTSLSVSRSWPNVRTKTLESMRCTPSQCPNFPSQETQASLSMQFTLAPRMTLILVGVVQFISVISYKFIMKKIGTMLYYGTKTVQENEQNIRQTLMRIWAWHEVVSTVQVFTVYVELTALYQHLWIEFPIIIKNV